MGRMDNQQNFDAYRGGIILIDKDEFCERVRTYENSMYALAFSILKNESDAGEAVCESIYRAYKNIDDLKNKNSFKPWILRIVHNTAVEMIRKNSKVILSMDAVEDKGYDGAENTITTQIALKEAINKLKPDYRTAIVLFYYENLSVSKIASVTGANIVSVKKRLSRARKALQEILKEDFNA